MKWQILEIHVDDELITHVRYFAWIEKDGKRVETEGHWYFNEPSLTVPLADVTEDMLLQWLVKDTTKDGLNPIKSRLEEQLKAQKQPVPAPWMPQTYTPNI